MRTISIDPGLKGAISIIDKGGQPETFYAMPTTQVGSKTRVCGEGLAEIIMGELKEDEITTVVVEAVTASPKQGPANAFSFGHSLGVIVGVCAGLAIPYFLITPQKWKTYMGLMKQPKDAARLKAIERFPQLAKQFKFKNTVDRADALLMGIAWRKLNDHA